jgi:hypothetical protein
MRIMDDGANTFAQAIEESNGQISELCHMGLYDWNALTPVGRQVLGNALLTHCPLVDCIAFFT